MKLIKIGQRPAITHNMALKSPLFPQPLPRYLLLLNSAALAFFIILLVQGYTFFNRISLLEKKIAGQPDRIIQAGSHLLKPMGSEVWNRMADGNRQLWQELPGDRIIIRRKTLLLLLELLRELNPGDAILPPALDKEVALFRRVVLGLPVDRAAFMDLLRRKNEIMSFLLRL